MKRYPFELKRQNNQYIFGMIDYQNDFKDVSKVCIVCNGMNGNRIEASRMLIKFSNVATTLRNMACVRFDYYGTGLSDGEFYESSIESRVADLFIVINFIKAKFYHENTQLFLIGFSDGIKVILDYLEKYTEENYQIIAWSPTIFELPSEVKERMFFTREPSTKSLVVPFGGLWVGKKYLQDLRRSETYWKKFIKHRGRIFCVFGSADSKTKKLQKINLRGYGIRKETIIGADHTFREAQWMKIAIDLTINHMKNLIDIHDDKILGLIYSYIVNSIKNSNVGLEDNLMLYGLDSYNFVNLIAILESELNIDLDEYMIINKMNSIQKIYRVCNELIKKNEGDE